MKTNKIFPFLLFLAVFFQGCEQVVDLNSIKPDPKLVLNGVVKAGEPVCANLSRTWFHTDGKTNLTIPDADVRLYVNDVFLEQLTFVAPAKEAQSGSYEAAYSPSAGDRIRITASAPGYPDIAAVSELPLPMPVASCRLLAQKSLVVDDDSVRQYSVNYTLDLTVKDEPAEANYYLIYGKEFWRGKYGYGYENGAGYGYEGGVNGFEVNQGDTVYWNYTYIHFSEEPLFKNVVTAFDYIFGTGGSQNNYWGAFSDELIDGRTYSMQLPLGWYGYTIYQSKEDQSILYPRKFRFYLQAISKDYFDYLKTLQELKSGSFTGDLASAGFAEPIRLPSNVEGGTGVLGSATECIYEWDERDIISFEGPR